MAKSGHAGMAKLLRYIGVSGVAVAIILWTLSRTVAVDQTALDGIEGNAARGETVFWAGGCASCHAAPESDGDARLILAGGYRIKSPFGTFVAPNISPSDKGIAGWSLQDLANALIAGVSPDGQHYYPSLPYASYARMTLQDVADLKAFMDGLPASDADNQPHELGFPFTVRRGLGLWKRLFLSDDWIVQLDSDAPDDVLRGRYLVEALGHCGECHTPRDVLGGLEYDKWLQGAPNPTGKGRIPGIAPGTLLWSAADIAYYLETGFTPDYDSAGGEMAHVVANLAHLTGQDRAAIAAYLKAIPAP
ncbi:c-type cytochrome [Arenibacterium sp. CAU 1754]